MTDEVVRATTAEAEAVRTSLIERTAYIVATFVEHNSVETGELPDLIASVHGALAGLGASTMRPAVGLPARAVTAQKSLADPERIVSMIDGKRYRMLARHLRAHGLTPAQYRTRFGLPASYPMVAPAHAAKRRALAEAGALGRKPKESATRAKPATSDASASKQRGRPRKAIV